MQQTRTDRIRLGAFEFDMRAGELRQGEQALPLQGKSVRVLEILIEHGGDIATREEIQKKLWPNDTVVDFDHGINTAIKNLRRALGDSADQPKYIETIARRGYRLIVPVEWVGPLSVASGQSGVVPTLSLQEDEKEPALSLPKGGAPAGRMQGATAGLIGEKVSHYRILEVLGGGGMGMVYKAEDLKLGRQVALKFLPEELGSDPAARQRFEREARAASSLDHPNICPIHEFGEHQDQPFIVMQFLEGETLRDRLAREARALPLQELLDIGIQVSEGLQAAHEKGIIHRDIKPANIFLTGKGVDKILDFGLAKLMEGPSFVSGPDFSPADETPPDLKAAGETALLPATLPDATLTRTGVAMGTAGYMSPEQVRGEKTDARTDIFSFGLVLYEMATGQRAFSGETAEVVHDAILNNAPTPVRELNSTLPAKLVSTIDQALEKNRDHRYQSAAEIRADLQWLKHGSDSRSPALISSPDNKVAQSVPGSIRKWKFGIAAGIMLVAAAIGSRFYFRLRPVPALTDKQSILLADFDNKTGDPVFDETIKQALAVALEQSPYLNVVPDGKVGETLRLMGRDPGLRITADLAREVCQRANARAMLQGSIASLGPEYVLLLKATDCTAGDSLDAEQVRVQSKDQVLAALDKVVTKLRGKLGESLSSTRKYNTPLEQATTPSLEALQAYNAGLQAWQTRGNEAAIPHYQRAIELDPNFAIAYAYLAQTYNNMGFRKDATENIDKAFQLRGRVTLRERFFIESRYHLIQGDEEATIQVCEQWRQVYPEDTKPVRTLALHYGRLGYYESALQQARDLVRLDPNSKVYQLDLAQAALRVDHLSEAQKLLEALPWDWNFPDTTRYAIAFLGRDTAMMHKLSNKEQQDPNKLADAMLHAQAYTEAYYGRMQNARDFEHQAEATLETWNDRQSANAWSIGYQFEEAVLEVEFGYLDKGWSTAARRLARSTDPGPDNAPIGALALARAGDKPAALAVIDQSSKENPQNTLLRNYWIPTIRAALSLSNHDPMDAVHQLDGTLRYELGSVIEYYHAPLFPVYLRGQAFLAMNKGAEAAAEFQKYVDHPGVVQNYPLAALARLGLARAYVVSGKIAEAKAAYQDFLTLWKDADPDIPIYKAAKAEYAKLQ